MVKGRCLTQPQDVGSFLAIYGLSTSSSQGSMADHPNRREGRQVDARTLPLSPGLQDPLYLFADAMMKALCCNVGRCVSDLHFPSSAHAFR